MGAPLLHSQPAPPWGDHVSGLRQVIDELMHRQRITYVDLAKKTGMSTSTLHKIATEKNVHMPKAAHLDKIALALGVHPRVLHEAAAESYGVQVAEGDTDSPGTDRTLLDNIARLDDSRKAAVIRLVKDLLDE